MGKEEAIRSAFDQYEDATMVPIDGLLLSNIINRILNNDELDDFDKTLKLLHESTHDKTLREAILSVQEYKTKYITKDE